MYTHREEWLLHKAVEMEWDYSSGISIKHYYENKQKKEHRHYDLSSLFNQEKHWKGHKITQDSWQQLPIVTPKKNGCIFPEETIFCVLIFTFSVRA